MRFIKIFLMAIILPMLVAATIHKFYVSTTNIEYSKKNESLQIISKIFIDDIEDVLQKRYDPTLSLDSKKETKEDAELFKQYISQKLKIWVDGKRVDFKYIGKQYDVDIVNVYIEVPNIKNPKTIEVEYKILFELFSEQQNIIHVKSDGYRRSLVLDKDNPKEMLKLN